MSHRRIVGIVLLLVGVALFVIGMNASESIADQFSNFFTGRFTDTTVWYIAVGAVAAVAGILLTLFGGRRSAE